MLLHFSMKTENHSSKFGELSIRSQSFRIMKIHKFFYGNIEFFVCLFSYKITKLTWTQ